MRQQCLYIRAIVVASSCILGAAAVAAPTGPDFTKPFFGCDRTVGAVPMLSILWDPHRPTDPAPAKQDVERLLFGKQHSVAGYFRENSYRQFRVTNAGVLGWYDAAKPADHYWGAPDEKDGDGDGFVNGHVEKWTEAIRRADKSFDFARYDRDHDGTLSTRELAVHIIIPQNGSFGTNRGTAGREYPTVEPLVVDGVQVPVIAESYLGAPPDLAVVVHELAHLMLNAPDMYFPFAYPYGAGSYSLMDWHGHLSHLDPFLKLRLGWARARIVTESGWQTLAAVEKHPEVLVLIDPRHSTSEYFIVENRWPKDSYEQALPDAGLSVWQIVDDAKALGSIPAPRGCDPSQWATVGADDWGRRAARMIRPVFLPQRDDKLALWDGSDPATGYDLRPLSCRPERATLRWADGSPSCFRLRHIPAAGPVMRFWVGME
jgi:M6 family metalloprotease-like protein